EGFRSQVGDDGIVDLKQSAIPLLTFLQSCLRLFPFSNVLRKRQHKSRRALRSRNERDVVVHPDETAILTPVLLLDLKLFSFSLQQFRGQDRVGLVIFLMSNLEKRERLEFLLC